MVYKGRRILAMEISVGADRNTLSSITDTVQSPYVTVNFTPFYMAVHVNPDARSVLKPNSRLHGAESNERRWPLPWDKDK